MRRLEWDLHNTIDLGGRIPEDWHEIAQTRGPRPKVKVTLWIEADVVRFFKSQGRGYGERIGAVLSASVRSGRQLNWPWVTRPVGLVIMVRVSLNPVDQATPGVTA